MIEYRKFKLIRDNPNKYIVVVGLSALLALSSFNVSDSPRRLENHDVVSEIHINDDYVNTFIRKATIKPEIEEKPFYEIDYGMDFDHQKYIWDLCQEEELDFVETMGLVWHESKFDPNAISATNDYGYFQVNINNHKRLSRILKIPNKPLDPYVNIKMGIYMLTDAYQQYADRGMSEEELKRYAWSIYNKGLPRFKKTGFAEEYIEYIKEGRAYIENIIEQEKNLEITGDLTEREYAIIELKNMRKELCTIKLNEAMYSNVKFKNIRLEYDKF
jgi:ASC-1-like (ASCH) protein